ncbi:class I SAM-dependent methyltransferase [Actinoalloteichus spitiensis]|uniref:methyltransferase n=1 Tax=Actinoalloteichus spitiensis TaxID=252394 RepID=UPI0002D274F5|nr:class I SAM-dependent methyltransferase [Actinoalloteichus spitiensis]
MTEMEPFRSVYETDGVYHRCLLPHYYNGREDLELISEVLRIHYGQSMRSLTAVEFGCGTGRVTDRLVPYSRSLTVADYSPIMIHAVGQRYPYARTLCADTRDAVAELLSEGRAGTFDLVGAFWSLSYPLGEFFEAMTAEGIQPAADLDAARGKASAFIHDMIRLLAPSGHLLALFFDSETPEQRLVTSLWERIAPFPEEGRSYTLNLLLNGLRMVEESGSGTVTHTRCGGTAWAPNTDAAIDWFNVVHLKSFPALVNDAGVQREIREFVSRYEQPTGDITLPSGVHVIDFHATPPPAPPPAEVVHGGHPACRVRGGERTASPVRRRRGIWPGVRLSPCWHRNTAV